MIGRNKRVDGARCSRAAPSSRQAYRAYWDKISSRWTSLWLDSPHTSQATRSYPCKVALGRHDCPMPAKASERESYAPEEVVIVYHERTKHDFHRFAASLGYMDWASQPDPSLPGTAATPPYVPSPAAKPRVVASALSTAGRLTAKVPPSHAFGQAASQTSSVKSDVPVVIALTSGNAIADCPSVE
jgi:hypothetical protein